MDEEAKRRVAQFRFGVIHDLTGDRKLGRGCNVSHYPDPRFLR